MTTFDVYINGIQQDFLSETKSVIEKTGKYLNIDIKKIEAAFSASNSNCIFKGITEKEAINHQKMLLEIDIEVEYILHLIFYYSNKKKLPFKTLK